MTATPLSCLWIIITTVFVLSALVSNIIAIVTNSWLKSSSSSRSDFLNIGLWTACFHNYVHTHESPRRTYDGCHAITSDYYASIQPWLLPSWLIACQVLAIIGLFLQVIATVFVLFLFAWILCKCLCGQESGGECCQRCLIYTTPILMIVSGMFMMMTAMAFADNAFKLQCKDFWVGGDPNNNRLSYSWGFEVAACILTFISGGLLIWIAVKTARDYKPYKVVKT